MASSNSSKGGTLLGHSVDRPRRKVVRDCRKQLDPSMRRMRPERSSVRCTMQGCIPSAEPWCKSPAARRDGHSHRRAADGASLPQTSEVSPRASVMHRGHGRRKPPAIAISARVGRECVSPLLGPRAEAPARSASVEAPTADCRSLGTSSFSWVQGNESPPPGPFIRSPHVPWRQPKKLPNRP